MNLDVLVQIFALWKCRGLLPADTVKIDIGTGAHSSRHGGAVLPSTLLWIWPPENEAANL